MNGIAQVFDAYYCNFERMMICLVKYFNKDEVIIMRKANNSEVKKINKNNVFRYINCREHASKPDIANALDLSTPTILQIVNELIAEGYVIEVGEYASTGGRKATAIATVKEISKALGIDITQNHISLVLTDLSGEVLNHKRIYYPFYDEEDYYKELGMFVNEYLHKNKAEDKICGIGISLPGIIDKNANKIVYSHALKLYNSDLSKFTMALNHNCEFINDANAAGISEVYNMINKKKMVYLSLSNSVGGTIINMDVKNYGFQNIDDVIYNGINGRAGEFGHMTLVPEGEKCYCGKQGCSDAYINAKVLAKNTDNRLETFFEELKSGNKAMIQRFDFYLEYLSIVINNIRMCFDCEVIVGGYVGSHIEPYINKLRFKAEMRNTFDFDASYIIPCKYKIEASALGAAILQIDRVISKI